jgi:hypothetical protein
VCLAAAIGVLEDDAHRVLEDVPDQGGSPSSAVAGNIRKATPHMPETYLP